MVLFSIGVCNADSDIDKLKGCWRSLETDYEIGNDYMKNISNGVKYEVKIEQEDKYIVMKKKHPKLKNHEIIRYVNIQSITDNSFMDSNIKEESPEDGLKFTRIQCPK